MRMGSSTFKYLFAAKVIVSLTAATIGTTETIMNHYAYASHNVINRGECKDIFENQGSTKKEANDLCRDPNIIIYGGKHCVSYVEQFGFSRDDAHDICQAFFTHKFNKSNP
jgi:hypothetical protein